jgi:outer membrane receptor protein involved in Fe transport
MIYSAVVSQENRSRPGRTITGNVYDAALQIPIEYANIVLHNQKDSSQVTGAITDPNGGFQLTSIRPGVYYLEIHFIGYHMKRISDIRLKSPGIRVDLGQIPLVQAVLSMEGVDVEGERPPIAYQIDKKVIDVDQQNTVISGNAAEVLENVPSVTVDIEGNVSLRGSSNFTLLIDGRPEPSDALQQIPASTIDNIEIITNPSVKYDPEGTSGIINIILKKNRQPGGSGMVNFNAGLNDKYGGDFLLDYQNGKYHAIFGADYNRRFLNGEGLEENVTSQDGNTSYIYSQGNSQRGRISKGVRGELELKLSPRDILNFGGRYGDRSSRRNSESDYDQWSEPDEQHSLYTSATDRERSGAYYALHSSYLHRFAGKGHEASAELYFRYRDGDEITTNELLTDEGIITSGQQTSEAGPSRDLRAKIDYTHPFSQENKFEAGYQGELDRSDDNTGLYEFDPEKGEYALQPQYSNSTRYFENVQALYALYSGKWNRLGYQGGLRGEYTYRTIKYDKEPQPFRIDRWDYFPTVHLSYQFTNGRQSMASYARRIDRPGGWELEPFETWMDAYNVRVGNPSLQPEYIDSYEIGYQMYFGKNLLSAEVYYRVTHNKIERVRSVYAANVTLHSVENIGTNYALGSEFLFNFDVLKGWAVNLMGNFYNYRIEGVLYEEPFSRESFNWRSRVSNIIKLGSSTQIQFDGIYRSPSVSSQGRREGFFTANAALKREFLNKQLSATLQVRDIFSTAKYEYTAGGADFYTYRYGTREAPVVMLNIRFNFNNYKPQRQRNGEQGNQGGDEEF